jgi:hypothetical protein
MSLGYSIVLLLKLHFMVTLTSSGLPMNLHQNFIRKWELNWSALCMSIWFLSKKMKDWNKLNNLKNLVNSSRMTWAELRLTFIIIPQNLLPHQFQDQLNKKRGRDITEKHQIQQLVWVGLSLLLLSNSNSKTQTNQILKAIKEICLKFFKELDN